jgi:hypothetical protein
MIVPNERWAGRIAMERSYVGALIRGARLDGVGPDNFLDPDLRQVISHIRTMQTHDSKLDVATLTDSLRLSGGCASGMDWGAFLANVIDAPAVVSMAPEYARRLVAYGNVGLLADVMREELQQLEAPGGASDPAIAVNGLCDRLATVIKKATIAKPLLPMTADEILGAAATPLQWVIKPLSTVQGIRIISGLGKVGKSTLATALALKSISGGAFTKHFDAGTGGHNVAIIDVENRPAAWARKLFPIARGLDVDAADLIRRGRLLYINRPGLSLDDPSSLHGVIDLLKQANVTEVILDSLTGIHSRDENKAVDMRAFFLTRIFALRDKVGAGITILHHHRKPLNGTDDAAQALRGTGDLRNVVDTHISISRVPKTPGVLCLEVTAQREAADLPPFYISMDWDTPGTLAFDHVDPGEQALPKSLAIQMEIMALVRDMTDHKASRTLLLDVLMKRGHAERTITRGLSFLSSGLAPSLAKSVDGRQTMYASLT